MPAYGGSPIAFILLSTKGIPQASTLQHAYILFAGISNGEPSFLDGYIRT